MKNKQFILRLCPGSTVRSLAHGLEDYLACEEGMRCIVMRTENGAYIVQGKSRHEEIARWAGLGRSVTIRLTPVQRDRMLVDIIPEKETGKCALLTAGVFFSWGIVLTSLCGMIRQRLLIRRVNQLIRGELYQSTAWQLPFKYYCNSCTAPLSPSSHEYIKIVFRR